MRPYRAALLGLLLLLAAGWVFLIRNGLPGSAQVPVAETATAQPLRVGNLLVTPHLPTLPVNYLLVGSTPIYTGYHTPGIEGFRGLTDTMLVVQIRPSGLIRILSVPRDTMVDLPGQGTQKINSANPFLGPSGMVQAVSELTGLPIRAYLIVNLQALRDFTRAVGGVRVYVPEPMDYTDHAAHLFIHLAPGTQRLSGRQAEAFIRFRHDPLGDIGRVQRTEAFLRAAAGQLLTPAGLSHLPAISAVLAKDTLSDLSPQDFSFVLGAALRHPRLQSFLLPGRYGSAGGISYWISDPASIQAMVDSFFLPRAKEIRTALDAKAAPVALVNVDGPPGTARLALARLRARGFQNAFIAQDLGSQPGQTVVLSDLSRSAAAQVRAALGFGQVEISGQGVLGAAVTVWLGADAAAGLRASKAPAS
jgi:LCP family protein required for cell wall assembly